jgi:hypothetical protein
VCSLGSKQIALNMEMERNAAINECKKAQLMCIGGLLGALLSIGFGAWFLIKRR